MMAYGLEEARKQLMADLARATAGSVPPASFPVVVRLRVPLLGIDPCTWLAGQKSDRKVFWSSVEGDVVIAGIGAALEVSAEGWYGFEDVWTRVNECINACPEARFFAGMSFERTVTAVEWKGFPALKFILPAVEIVKDSQGSWLVANAVRGRDGEPFSLAAKTILESLRFVEHIVSDEDVTAVSREDVPDYEDWVYSAEAIVDSLEKEGLEKVVLARRVSFELQGSLIPENILLALMAKQKTDFSFLFGADGAAFFGISSEPLYVRQGVKVHSRAVAGGRPRGKDPADDDKARDALLKSEKDLKEHKLVAGALIEVFRELCRSYQVDCEKEILRSTHYQYLLMRLSGVLSDGVSDKEFLQALHPAPLVCGVPAEKARLLLQQFEVFDRGWFSGLVGFFSKDRTELSLVARACLFETNNLHGYAGAPFVKGADPFVQWEEAAREMRHILNLVHGVRL